MTSAPLPAEGWGRTVSYRMRIVQAVVADIRDHGPFDLDLLLAAIKRAGVGGDVRKASPAGDEHDGALRILNLMVDDLGVIAVVDGRYSVPADVREVRSSFLGGVTIPVPSENDLIAGRDRARRQTQLRSWLRQRPFQNQWKTEIRHWDDDAQLAMALAIDTLGYFGPPIVRDQDDVVIDGHLRHLGLEHCGIDPAQHTVTRTFDGDLDRLAWIINAHRRPGERENWQFPASLKAAIIKLVDHGKPRGALKDAWAPMSWPDEIGLMLGKDRRDYEETEPTVAPPRSPIIAPTPVDESPVVPVDHPSAPVLLASPEAMTESILRVADVLDRHGPMNDLEVAKTILEEGGKLKGTPSQTISNRFTEMRRYGWAEHVHDEHGPLFRDGHAVHAITDACRLVLNTPWRPAPTTTDRPGTVLRNGPSHRLSVIRQLIVFERNNPGDGWMTKAEIDRGREKVAFSLRRIMWFQHLDLHHYVLIPDTCARRWRRMRIRELRHTEFADLRECSTFEETCDRWERLVDDEAILSP